MKALVLLEYDIKASKYNMIKQTHNLIMIIIIIIVIIKDTIIYRIRLQTSQNISGTSLTGNHQY